jgi:hypothetical protein
MRGAAEEFLGAELMHADARERAIAKIAAAPVSRSRRRSLYFEWQLLTKAPLNNADLRRVTAQNEWDRSQQK